MENGVGYERGDVYCLLSQQLPMLDLYIGVVAVVSVNDECSVCINNKNGKCIWDWGCNYDPDPEKLEVLEMIDN